MPPSIIASVCSLVLAGVIAFGNTQAQWRCQRHQAAGHEAVHRPAGNACATRAEVKAVNDKLTHFMDDTHPRLERIENLLLKELQLHQKASGR